MKFLIALQYWEGDREPAIELLELFYQTITEQTPYADLVIYYRFDCLPPPKELTDRLARSFQKVFILRGKEHCIGYPDGSNGLWESLAMDALLMSTQSNIGAPPWSHYKAILSIESDVCPISKDWIRELSIEWDTHSPASIVGAWGACGAQEIGHINGNMMFSLDIHKKIPCLTPPLGKAWDTWFAPDFKKVGWAPTVKIVNWFKHASISDRDFKNLIKAKTAILHGVKDDTARKHYLSNQ